MNTIIGLGEILWDIFPDGRKVAGGAPFNFAFHCHQLGHPATIVSRVGGDELGRELRARVLELGLSDDLIQTDPDLPTGTVRVTVDEAGQPTYVIDTHAAWGNLEWIPALAELCQGAAALCHGTLALDGGKASREVIERMAQLVNENAGLTVYDVNLRGKYAIRPDKRAVERSQWLKVNEVELEVLEKLNEPLEATVKGTLMERVLVITRGEDGAEVRSSSLRHRGSGPDVKVVDTIGAGDAFTAAMVCLHLEGRPLNECLRFANFYAARVCEFQGATPQVKRTDVEREAFGRLT